MKKNLFFGSSLLIAAAWVVYASLFFYTNSLNVLSPSSFFYPTDTITIVNNSSEYRKAENNTLISFNNTPLDRILTFVENNPFWQKIYFTKKNDTSINKLIIEGKRTLDFEDLIPIYKLFAIDTTHIAINEVSDLKNSVVLSSRKYFSISLSGVDLLNPKDFKLNFNDCDERATYNILSKKERKDIYQTETQHRVFVAQQSKNNYTSVSDRNYYAVMPSQTQSFLFIEKNILTSTFPKWQGNQLLPVFDKGIMQTKFAGKKVMYFEINGQYTPNEIKDLFAEDDSHKNASVFPLNISTPNFQHPYATCLENILILSGNKQTLEDIRIHYQIGKIFNTTSFYDKLINTKPKKISVRWWGTYDLSPFQIDNSKEGAIVFQEKVQQRILVLDQTTSTVNSKDNSSYQLLWTKTVGNASSIKTTKGLIAVWSKADNKITIVSDDAKVLRKINLKRTYLNLLALRDGFILIGKTNILWIPTNTEAKILPYDFETQLQNIAADYTWEGRQELGLLTKNQLICLNVKDSKTAVYSLPDGVGKPSNFYAFNYEGNLGFSMTNADATFLFDTKTKKNEEKNRAGNIVAVEKFGLNVFYLLKSDQGYNIQQNDQETVHLSVPKNYVFFGSQNTDNVTCFVFRKNNRFVVYDINTQHFSQFEAPIKTVEKVAVANTSNNKKVLFFLDGVQNNIYLQNEAQPNDVSNHIEGSHFVYSKTTTQIVTYLDGNLVCYKLND